MSDRYDSNFIAQMSQASKRKLHEQQSHALLTTGRPTPEAQQEATNNCADPTFELRRRQANLCEAVMVRVFDLEAQAAALTETAKKLRAAVMANT